MQCTARKLAIFAIDFESIEAFQSVFHHEQMFGVTPPDYCTRYDSLISCLQGQGGVEPVD